MCEGGAVRGMRMRLGIGFGLGLRFGFGLRLDGAEADLLSPPPGGMRLGRLEEPRKLTAHAAGRGGGEAALLGRLLATQVAQHAAQRLEGDHACDRVRVGAG
eukprot:scaffold23619_cov32-Phaeocystis_antarctica.AAC.1